MSIGIFKGTFCAHYHPPMDFCEMVKCAMRRPSQRPPGLPSRLQLLADLAGSALALAELSGVSRKALGEWLTGKREPSPYALRKFVEAGVDQEWLLTGKGLAPRSIAMGVVKSAAFPLTDPFGDSKSILSADADWLQIHLGLRKDNTLLIHAPDDEMAPAICRGEPILARSGGIPGLTWKLFVIRFFEGMPSVRWVKRDDERDGLFSVRSENEETHGHTLDGEDGFLIVGEVVWHGTKVISYTPTSRSGRAPMRRRQV